MCQVNLDMTLKVDKMTFECYQTKDGKWIQLLGTFKKKCIFTSLRKFIFIVCHYILDL